MEGIGQLILHRFNGDEVYRLRTATIRILEGEDGLRLWFEVETDDTGSQVLADTVSLRAIPRAEIDVACDSLSDLVGRRFLVPAGEDADGETVATFYYSEHQVLDNNEVEILGRRGDRFRVRWSCTTMDVNYYDGSKPDTRIEIEGDFTFEELDAGLEPK